MRNWLILLLSAALAGCGTAPVAPRDTSPLFNDSLFSPASEHVGADRIFEVSPEMRRFLKSPDFAYQVKKIGPQEALYDALYARGQLMLDYDSSITRTASEAFAARSGNCLSMAIMTAAMAREIGLLVRFQRVHVDEVWSRVGKIYFSTGHVNVTLKEKPSAVALNINRAMTIDFVPPSESRRLPSEGIEEKTIAAMFMNNRAAESLAAGKLDDAYWWARAAVQQDPQLQIAYNTLGVVYRTHGNLAEAEHAFNQALARQPKDVIVMSNLAQVLDTLGRKEEAQQWERRVEQLRPYPPFHYFDQGMAAMKKGDYKLAKKLFRKELDRAPDYHEFQYWFAMACLGLGETSEAKKYLALAMENSTTRKDHDVYAAKLARLRAAAGSPASPS